MKSLSLLSVFLAVQHLASAANVAQQPLGQHSDNIHGDGFLQSEELDRYIQDVMDEWHAPGLAVSVVRGNETWAKVGLVPLFLPSVQDTVLQCTFLQCTVYQA
jgi:CubicO group peptidase (beta-lactamase class C family)